MSTDQQVPDDAMGKPLRNIGSFWDERAVAPVVPGEVPEPTTVVVAGEVVPESMQVELGSLYGHTKMQVLVLPAEEASVHTPAAVILMVVTTGRVATQMSPLALPLFIVLPAHRATVGIVAAAPYFAPVLGPGSAQISSLWCPRKKLLILVLVEPGAYWQRPWTTHKGGKGGGALLGRGLRPRPNQKSAGAPAEVDACRRSGRYGVTSCCFIQVSTSGRR
ncbi:hypothetical protein J2Y66_003466 [Paenarthrobacter nitroguajacolicus]|nr:hypothetical protein [Paenarthrobacter nitroguajacolicus]